MHFTGWIRTSVAIDSSSNFIITFYDSRNGNLDIYAQRYNADGNADGSNFLVNNDEGSSYQSNSTIAVDVNGDFIIAWEDERNGFSNIYAQRYDTRGQTIGANFTVNDSNNTSRNPSIVIDNNGNSVITWDEYNPNTYSTDIHVQRYDIDGNAVGTNLLVNDDGGILFRCQSNPYIAINSSGNYIIVWEDERDGTPSIYAQRYDLNGNAIGCNFLVNNDGRIIAKYNPSVAIDSSGNFVITWYEHGSGNYDIYAQCYNADGDTIGSNFIVNDDESNSNQINPCVAFKSSGNFVITWEDGRNGNPDIYAQHYNVNGCVIGNNFLVNNDEGAILQENPSIAVDSNGDIIIIWGDSRNGNADIYAQLYDSDGTAVGNNFLITNDNHNQISPCVQYYDGQIYTTWQDSRIQGQGWDIWANVLSIINTGLIGIKTFPVTFILYSNYPNPFNSTTTIKYDIPKASHVEITIYNMNGQVVDRLVNQKQETGFYSVRWDARNVSTGVYFYQIKADRFQQVKKMLLIK